MKKIICITGIDGAGTATLIEMLQARYPESRTASIWDVFENQAKTLGISSREQLEQYLCGLTSDSRLLFLSHALRYALDKALMSSESMIFFNGYFYKYFATELALGANRLLVEALEKSFPRPAFVIELAILPDEAARRKHTFSCYECGMAKTPSAENFIKFQSQTLREWQRFGKNYWYKLDSRLEKEIIFQKTIEIIEQP